MSTPEERRQRYMQDLLDFVSRVPMRHFEFCRSVSECNCGVALIGLLAYRAKCMWQTLGDEETTMADIHRMEDEMKAAHGLKWTELGYAPKDAGDHVRDHG